MSNIEESFDTGFQNKEKNPDALLKKKFLFLN